MVLLDWLRASLSGSAKQGFSRPWGKHRPAIYEFIKAHIWSDRRLLPDTAQSLPDSDEFNGDDVIRWVSGGRDGNARFTEGLPQAEVARQATAILAALRRVVDGGGARDVGVLYRLLVEFNTHDYIDELLPRVAEAESLDLARLRSVAHWLATAAPDRGPVKFGMALLGLFSGSAHQELLYTLGRHEEFTLFAAVALKNALDDPAPVLQQLALHVEGWGRIAIVERLADTTSADIKGWLLREGYRNVIMNEYLAHLCAVTGNLLAELRRPTPDEALMRGAGDIIEALMNGGPAKDMSDYADGAEATRLFLKCARGSEMSIAQLLVIKRIADFVADGDRNWLPLARHGWSVELRRQIADDCAAILTRPDWHDRVTAELQVQASSPEWEPFHTAAAAAEVIGIDTWDYYFERQQDDHADEWYYLMQSDDPSRIDKVVALAERVIPLDQVATGPGAELGLGPEFRHHSAVGFIVQDLRRFPGKGWGLVRVALESPVVSNRNMALRALSAWGKAQWPDEAETVLEKAWRHEPEADVKDRLRQVLDGELID
jgi:hypothetical protein